MEPVYKYGMEREVLEAVYNFGEIGCFNRCFTEASQVLIKKYPSGRPGEHDPQQPLTSVINYLLEERYLYPYIDDSGKELRDGYARGLTPKGLDRLKQLQRPVRTWISANWFPVIVAAVTASIAIASIVVNLMVGFR